MKIHELKTEKEYFDLSWNGVKKYEIRLNDRDYKVGHILNLIEFTNTKDESTRTGREIAGTIDHIFDDFGLEKNFVIISLCGVERFTLKAETDNGLSQ